MLLVWGNSQWERPHFEALSNGQLVVRGTTVFLDSEATL